MNGYQLLNEVGTGGTLSSLFTILSLFTENVKISWQDDEPTLDLDDDMHTTSDAESTAGTERTSRLHAHVRHKHSNSDVPSINLDAAHPPEVASPPQRGRGASVSSSGSTVHATPVNSPPRFRSVSQGPSISGASSASAHTYRRRPVPEQNMHHYGVVARATEDSTLAVIPAEAFRRLTKKFPKAAAHIVQGIVASLPGHRRWLMWH